MGYRPQGHKESDRTKRLHFHFLFFSQLFVRPPQKTGLPFCIYHLKRLLMKAKEEAENAVLKLNIHKTDFWTLWEKARVGCFERTALKHVYYLG